jgi:asparagine synthase (glutamine-hydrolysing)
MVSRIAHRGPDAQATWVGANSALGHARLSILDIARGAQPMSDPKSRSRIVFNGEIYNYAELRKGLGSRAFRTNSDTEVLLALHDDNPDPLRWLPKLDGMFAFAIVSPRGLTLARDPLGVKPLYLGWKGSEVMFASEIKALVGLADHICEFPPGHVFTPGIGLRRYFRLGTGQQQEYDAEVVIDETRDRLERAVETRMLADVPVGAFLSGGLDSSLIAALAKRHTPDLHTFCVGLEGAEDIEAAQVAARHIGSRHFERVFTMDDAIRALPKIIYHLESFDCALVRSAVANYFLAELASDHVKVVLSGEGADELFAGYAYLRRLRPFELKRELIRSTLALHNTNLQRCDRISMAHGLEVRVPFLDDLNVVEYAFRTPVQFKISPVKVTDKWVLRKVADGLLPEAIVHRPKLKFAEGAGLGSRLADHAEKYISDAEFTRAVESETLPKLRSKEEMLYYHVFRGFYPDRSLEKLPGRSASI